MGPVTLVSPARTIPIAASWILLALAPGCASPGAAPRHVAPGTGLVRTETPVPHPAAPPAPPRRTSLDGPWLDPRGTSIVGFGLLRVVPDPGRTAVLDLRYREVPDGYSSKGNLQVFVLPADAFARRDRAYAGDFLAFARTRDEEPVDDDYALRTGVSGVEVDRERTLLVAYGPWTAPDAGRPAGDVPVFRVEALVRDGEASWIESEAGELITTNWTSRPEVERGTPCTDNVTGRPLWIEVRPMILYDARLARAVGEPVEAPPGTPSPADLRAEAERLESEGRAALAADRRDRAADAEAELQRADRRLVLTPELAEKFRRVPIRWR